MNSPMPSPEIISIFGMFSALFFLIIIFLGTLSLAATILWVWMIVDCLQNEPSVGNDKITWILILIFTGVIGAVLYLFLRKLPRTKQAGSV